MHELYGDSTQLLFLRARHYSPADGRFTSRDTWTGDYNRPLSLNRWMYVEGNPVNQIDSTGHIPLRLGYIEGRSWGGGLGTGYLEGVEIVYDYATMTRARFTYTGVVGGFLLESWGGTIYVGGVDGFRYDTDKHSNLIKEDYEGLFIGGYGGVGIAGIYMLGGLSGGGGYFHSPDWRIKGVFGYISLSVGHLPFEGAGFETEYDIEGPVQYYADKDGFVNRSKLISDILSGANSPALGILSSASGLFMGARNSQIGLVLLAAKRFEDFHVKNPYFCQPPQRPYGPPRPPLFPPTPNPFEIPLPGNMP